MLVHILDELVRIHRQNKPQDQPGLLLQGITHLLSLKYGMVWYSMVCGMVWCGVVWCGEVWCSVVWYGMVWSGLLKKDLALLIRLSFTYKKPLQKLDTF